MNYKEISALLKISDSKKFRKCINYIEKQKSDYKFKNNFREGIPLVNMIKEHFHIKKSTTNKSTMNELENRFCADDGEIDFDKIQLYKDNKYKVKYRTHEYYMVLDIETIGIPREWIADESSYYEFINIVEISYMICDKNGNELKEENMYVYPKHREICHSDAERVHGLSYEFIKKEGHTIDKCIEQMIVDIDEYNVDAFVGHNVNFDINIINNNCKVEEYYNKIFSMDTYCTFEIAKELKFESKKLKNVYKKLTDKDDINWHKADEDVMASKKIFFETTIENDFIKNDMFCKHHKKFYQCNICNYFEPIDCEIEVPKLTQEQYEHESPSEAYKSFFEYFTQRPQTNFDKGELEALDKYRQKPIHPELIYDKRSNRFTQEVYKLYGLQNEQYVIKELSDEYNYKIKPAKMVEKTIDGIVIKGTADGIYYDKLTGKNIVVEIKTRIRRFCRRFKDYIQMEFYMFLYNTEQCLYVEHNSMYDTLEIEQIPRNDLFIGYLIHMFKIQKELVK